MMKIRVQRDTLMVAAGFYEELLRRDHLRVRNHRLPTMARVGNVTTNDAMNSMSRGLCVLLDIMDLSMLETDFALGKTPFSNSKYSAWIKRVTVKKKQKVLKPQMIAPTTTPANPLRMCHRSSSR